MYADFFFFYVQKKGRELTDNLQFRKPPIFHYLVLKVFQLVAFIQIIRIRKSSFHQIFLKINFQFF